MTGLVQVSKQEYESLAAFRYALRKFLHFSEQAANEVGLTAQQHQALLAIMGYPGKEQINISELAERLQIQHHSAVGLVDRLVSLSLVERSAAGEDRRKVLIALTAHGRDILDQLVFVHKEELRRVTPGLTQQLKSLQPKLSANSDE